MDLVLAFSFHFFNYFKRLNVYSGPVMALALCREDAVSGWRDVLGPKNVDEAKDIAPER